MATKQEASNNRELIEALDQIEKEKDISKEILLEEIENSLLAACKNEFGKSDNIVVSINRETGAVGVFADKTIVETVSDSALEMTLAEAHAKHPRKKFSVGDVVRLEVTPRNFGRIAAQKAKQVVVQKIREEERKVLYNHYLGREHEVVTGIVQRYVGNNVSINLGKCDAVLTENEQIKSEHFTPTQRIRVYVLEVKDTPKGPKITVSRTHKDLVKRLFEEEVTEVKDGIVEIKSIAREAGARTKMAVYSNDPNVDAVGACVGLNGARVNAIVGELNDEKIDIINWSDDPEILIENALSPAKVVSVRVSVEDKSARVIVPDYQLSLAIGKEGQNARLAARLTGYKIDIKSESQAEAAGEYIEPAAQTTEGYEGEYYDANYQGDYYDPDAQGDYYDPDAQGDYYDPDAQGDYYDPDAQGDYYDPDDQGDYYDPDAQDEYYDAEAQDQEPAEEVPEEKPAKKTRSKKTKE
ncbi:MAG: transcription termination/antitermination protein NusA [Lachnospiraceae bacterium]|nr:transcription termination/antitermination protein NusA [Lachnospiraceae bacterium]